MKRFRALASALLVLTLSVQALAFGGGHWGAWAHRPWSPRDVGLTAWYKAGRGVTIVTGVSNWADQSLNARDLVQATTNKQPAFSATAGPNSTAAITGDGSNDNLKVTGGFTFAQPEQLFIVVKWNGVFASAEDPFDGNAGNSMRMRRNNTTQVVITSSNDLANSGFSTLTSWHYYTTLFSGVNSYIKQDGTTIAGPGNAGVVSGSGLQLFTFGDGASDPCACSIAEVMLSSRTLDSTEEARINFYLHADYGL